jgi:hypothetical protein
MLGTVLIALGGVLSRVAVLEALSFALSVMAVVAMIEVRRKSRRLFEISADVRVIRVYKNETGLVKLTTNLRSEGLYSISVASVKPPEGTDVRLSSGDSGSEEIALTPRYAGRFSGLEVVVELTDALGIFVVKRFIELENFYVESLPRAILEEGRLVLIPSFSLGERPSGQKGSGQEMYSVESYQSGMAARDILWKRVAQRPDESLFVGSRESSVPEKVRIAVLEAGVRRSSRLHWSDSASEGIAKLCISLVLAGSTAEISYLTERGVRVRRVSRPEEVADSLMEMWSLIVPSSSLAPADSAHVVVLPYEFLSEKDVARRLSGKQKLVVSDGLIGGLPRSDTLAFSGTEDVTSLLLGVLG